MSTKLACWALTLATAFAVSGCEAMRDLFG